MNAILDFARFLTRGALLGIWGLSWEVLPWWFVFVVFCEGFSRMGGGGFVREVLSGGFCPEGFVREVLSGGLVLGVWSGGFCPRGFCSLGVLSIGEFCPTGYCPGGFVRGVLSGGFCPGGFCPRIHCLCLGLGVNLLSQLILTCLQVML